MATQIKIENDTEVIEPKLYKVILLNDDYTTFDFVIGILRIIFNKSENEAVNLTLKIDREGKAVVGIYPYEIAKTKVNRTHEFAQQEGFPLRAIMEEK